MYCANVYESDLNTWLIYFIKVSPPQQDLNSWRQVTNTMSFFSLRSHDSICLIFAFSILNSCVDANEIWMLNSKLSLRLVSLFWISWHLEKFGSYEKRFGVQREILRWPYAHKNKKKLLIITSSSRYSESQSIRY